MVESNIKRSNQYGYFFLEGLNAFASSFYFYYLFFFMAQKFHFGNKQNLFLAALNGFVYMFAARFGGRFAQQHGYFPALRTGFTILTLALVAGAFGKTAVAQIAVLVAWTFGICFTWPTLEALVSEHESPRHLPRIIGLYNLVWSACGAIAYFAGGALLEGFGMFSLFWIPAALHLVQLALTWHLERKVADRSSSLRPSEAALEPLPLNPRPISKARLFLKMAWLANPFGYVAINTLAAVIPALAQEHALSPAAAGVFGSLWFFSRLATFCILWIWEGWHYRFSWFAIAYLLLFAGFVSVLLAPSLWLMSAAQIAFGMGLGLLYYSSLFYSMDAGEAKGEHGGIHEAAIGSGIFAGPAIGGAALALFPNYPRAETWAVALLLLAGFAGVLWIRSREIRAGRPG